MPDKILLIRADASSEIGVGHVMRCAALAQAWRSAGGRVIFALATGARELETQLRSVGSKVALISVEPGSAQDAAETCEFCRSYEACWLALDGYHFPQSYRAALKNSGARLLFVDDLADSAPYECDIVLNDNPGAEKLFTGNGSGVRFLLGSRYALLRQEFLEANRELRDAPARARQILVTFGGGDQQNATLKMFEALQEVRDSVLDITVVVGASNPHRRLLEEAVGRSAHSAKILVNVKLMPELMSQSDLAVSAGGGTCYELAFMQVPMLLVIAAKNQERTVNAFSAARAAVSAGWFASIEEQSLTALLAKLIGDRTLRQQLRENAGRIVDGRGAQRVVETMLEMQNEARG